MRKQDRTRKMLGISLTVLFVISLLSVVVSALPPGSPGGDKGEPQKGGGLEGPRAEMAKGNMISGTPPAPSGAPILQGGKYRSYGGGNWKNTWGGNPAYCYSCCWIWTGYNWRFVCWPW